MIPNKIHYFWFGEEEKPELVEKCIETWKNVLKDYEIIEWNESNYNINKHSFLKKAYKNKKWAFVSDFARLDILYHEGGIYLDTDVEVKKSFDLFLNDPMFIGFMFDCNLGTAIIGAEKRNKVLKELLAIYDELEFNDSPNNDLFTRYFLGKYGDFKLNNKNQDLGDLKIYKKEYFERPTYSKEMGYSVHHFMGSWWRKSKKESNLKFWLKKILKKILGEVFYGKLLSYKALKISPFYGRYLEDRKR